MTGQAPTGPDPHARAAELGSVLRARRRSLRLRQDELADLAGVSERFVYALESGKPTMRLDKLLAVLYALGLHLEVHRDARPGFVPALPESGPR